MTFNSRPKRRLRVSTKQAEDIQNLAKVTGHVHEENVALKASLAKLQRIWDAGEVEMGRGEDGQIMARRIAVLVAIVKDGDPFPDVRQLIEDMPEPADSKLIQ